EVGEGLRQRIGRSIIVQPIHAPINSKVPEQIQPNLSAAVDGLEGGVIQGLAIVGDENLVAVLEDNGICLNQPNFCQFADRYNQIIYVRLSNAAGPAHCYGAGDDTRIVQISGAVFDGARQIKAVWLINSG